MSWLALDPDLLNVNSQVVKIVPDRKAISGSQDGIIRIWDLANQTCLWFCSGHIGPLVDIDASVYPCLGSVSSGHDCVPRIWQVDGFDPHASDRALHLLEGHEGNVLCIGFTRDGKYLATGGTDATVRIWRCDDALCVRIFEHGRQAVTCLAVSGGLVATGSTDAAIQVWDVDNLRRHCTFAGHHMGVTSVFMDEVEGRLISASVDGHTMVWGLARGGEFLFAMNSRGIQSTKPDVKNVPEHIVVQAVQGDDIITKTLFGYPLLRTFNSSSQAYARKAGPCGFLSAKRDTDNPVGGQAESLPSPPPNTARDALAHYEVEIGELADLAAPPTRLAKYVIAESNTFIGLFALLSGLHLVPD